MLATQFIMNWVADRATIPKYWYHIYQSCPWPILALLSCLPSYLPSSSHTCLALPSNVSIKICSYSIPAISSDRTQSQHNSSTHDQLLSLTSWLPDSAHKSYCNFDRDQLGFYHSLMHLSILINRCVTYPCPHSFCSYYLVTPLTAQPTTSSIPVPIIPSHIS